METLSKHKILVIDDEDVMLDCCKQTLSNNESIVEAVKDGTTGLSKVREIEPDVVLVDLKMPGINGMEVLEKINEIDEQIIMIVITGYGTLETAIEAMKKGAYDFITKPFTPDVLRMIVRRAIEKRKMNLESLTLRQEKENLRQNFISIISHEIKSPLVTVQQNLEILLNEMVGRVSDKQKEILLRMNNQLSELVKLVNDWQGIASIETQKIAENMEILKLDEIIYDAETNIGERLRNKRITLKLNILDNLPKIRGDRTKLKEVFINLLDNAIKYNREDGRIEITAKENGDYVTVSVSDTGVGIDSKYLPAVFDEFFRIRDNFRINLGAGLGLFIVRKIVEAHSGKIDVASELGKGSTFTVFLPKAK